MATVYRALDTRLGRVVAVKVLHPQYSRDEPFLQRFQQEAEFAASLGAHPNIVAIYDVGQDHGVPFIVMEYVAGRSLKDLIRERAPFEVSEAFAIGAQVAAALEFAHSRGLVHRDVKPQNILVTPDGRTKVTDFGIARSTAASQLTRTGMVMGTVHYFSPEQAQGRTVTPASDIYSLGVILYEMLTGHLPFTAETPIAVAMQHVHATPPSPWDYNPNLPTRAVATVMRALEKDPERRYRNAAEFEGALVGQAASPAGDTTVMGTLSPDNTTIVAPVPSEAERTVVGAAQRTRVARQRPVRQATVAERPRSNSAVWLALTGVLLAGIIGLAAFFATTRALGGAQGSSSPTPTVTPAATATPRPTATPVKRHRPTATSKPIVAPQPTVTPAAITATPLPPSPTTAPPPTSVPTRPLATAVPPRATLPPATATNAVPLPTVGPPQSTAAPPQPTAAPQPTAPQPTPALPFKTVSPGATPTG